MLLGLFWSGAGVYSTRTVVSFTFPYESSLTPDNATSNESVIAFAGAVASQISPNTPTVRYSAGDAPYYGAGLRQGILVGLRDDGSQWAPSYGTAVIEIQIVGQTEQWVAEQQSQILARVKQSTEAQQSGGGIAPEERITARVEPLTLRIEHITPSRMAQAMAAAAMVGAGVLVAAWAAVASDEVLSRRDQRRAPTGGRVS
ncbi:hypothetical protein NQ156_10850 [Microbacterium sp. zg.Y625]|uniref:hypothetical protein n=1 Tax=Microbacterium jiangjiandongii TaxID=3049071 RepID=UPI00214CCFA2|nr:MULTISPECIES: hypothetical protein [unclassified Microbacterium]MCR2793560.1 hypothetical protein [Microbacterium sp. zg.Y625]WIM25914.1 hypothetical protein QNO14_02335 [Microbacterium sp. zg-Y625]